MVNGFFIMELRPFPISQTYKFFVWALILLRLCFSKDIFFVFLLFVGFQVAPVFGLLKTGNFSIYFRDVIDASRWLTVPLGFFYFKTLFQSMAFPQLEKWIKGMVFCAFIFIAINLFLGALGFGQAFYFHGWGNAVGTKGFIYAGNELTILVLTIGFIMAAYLRYKRKHFVFLIVLVMFLLFAFLITSKTVLAGVVIVFAIPWIKGIPKKISSKWLNVFFVFLLLGIPLLIGTFYWGIMESGVLSKMETSARMHDGDFLSMILSSRNEFLLDGWRVYTEEYSFVDKLFGAGQSYFMGFVKNSPELDFFTILFNHGLFGLLLLLLLIWYWFLNTKSLSANKDFVFSNQVLLLLVFLVIVSNLAGHIFNSAVAGFFIGLAIAIMFYKVENRIM